MTRSEADALLALRLGIDRAGRTPIATQIAEQLTSRIASGVLVAGNRLPATSDVADHLEVNVHTVRAAYAQLAADGVIAMQRGSRALVLGFDANAARTSRTGIPTFTIGVMVPHFSDYYAEFLQAVAQSAEVEGWLPIICQTRQYEAGTVARYVDQMASRGVDGLIALHFETPDDAETTAALAMAADHLPLVFVDSAPLEFGYQIMVDRVAGALEATKHLLDHGHRRVAFISTPIGWNSRSQLRQGYLQALEEAGLEPDVELEIAAGDMSLDAGAKAASSLMLLDNPPEAIFCAGDILALGALQHLQDMRVSVPEDVSIMGYGELPFSSLAGPPLSSSRLPARELGELAVANLRDAIDGRSQTQVAPIQTSLVARRSCGCR